MTIRTVQLALYSLMTKEQLGNLYYSITSVMKAIIHTMQLRCRPQQTHKLLASFPADEIWCVGKTQNSSRPQKFGTAKYQRGHKIKLHTHPIFDHPLLHNYRIPTHTAIHKAMIKEGQYVCGHPRLCQPQPYNYIRALNHFSAE